jgi:hypothetical protein
MDGALSSRRRMVFQMLSKTRATNLIRNLNLAM